MGHIAHAILQPILLLLLAEGVHSVADETASANLHDVLEHRSEIVHKPKSNTAYDVRLEMRQHMEDQFETLESAYDFVALLGDTVAEAKRELEGDVQRESASDHSRRLDALRVALYSLDKLELHVNRSQRILNDLRSIRRLLFEERGRTVVAQSATAQHASRAVQIAPDSPNNDSQSAATVQNSLAANTHACCVVEH